MLETIKATVIRENQAIRLRARKEGVDRGGVQRVTGERPVLPQEEFKRKDKRPPSKYHC